MRRKQRGKVRYRRILLEQLEPRVVLSGDSIFLGPQTDFNDQPYVDIELLDGSTGLGPYGSGFGIYPYNRLLLDTGANSVLIVSDAAADLEANGYSATDGTYLEQGVAGYMTFDVSDPYRLEVTGSDGGTNVMVPHDAVRVMSSPDIELAGASAESGGIPGLVGMPAMDGRVTTFDFEPWEGITDLLDMVPMGVRFSDALPVDDGHRYTVGLDNRVTFDAEDGAEPGTPVPVWSDIPFFDATVRHRGRESTGAFLLDTGAQMSMIAPSLAFDLGLDEDGDGDFTNEAITTIPIGGVGGSKDVPVLVVEQFRIPTDQGVDLVWHDPWTGRVVQLTPVGGPIQIDETGGVAFYEVELLAQPSQDVTISLSSPDGQLQFGAAADLESTVLTFTSTNWETPQLVQVQANQDAAVEGTHFGAIVHSSTSGDADFQDLPIDDLVVTINDDDTLGPGVLIDISGGTTEVTETALIDTYDVVLNSPPTDDVTVTIVSGPQLETVPASLVFTSTNYNVPQRVEVKAVDDEFLEGLHTGTIIHTVASSDSQYDQLPVGSVTADITDNDLGLAMLVLEVAPGIDGIFGVDLMTSGVSTGFDPVTWEFELSGAPYFQQVHVDFSDWAQGSGEMVFDVNPTYDHVVSAVDAPLITSIANDTGTVGDGITSDTTLVISGTAPANSSVEVFRNATSIGSTTTDGSGAWSLDDTDTTLSEGLFNLTAKATDTAGNTSPASAAFGVTIDTTEPTVAITRQGANPTAADTLTFRLDFSEAVDHVTAADLALSLTETATADAVVAVDDAGDADPATYTVTVTGVAGDGKLGLDIAGGNDITDSAGNPLNTTPTTDQKYTLDTTLPQVASFTINTEQGDPSDLAKGPQPTSRAQQRSDIHEIVVTFDEPVADVTTADLLLTNLGVNAPADPDTVVPLSQQQLNLVQGHTKLIISLEPFQLADGVYELRVLQTVTDTVGNQLDGNGSRNGRRYRNGSPAVFRGNSTNRFFKLTADYNGSGGVQIQDFATFSYWFGNASPPAPAYVDLNNSGGINIQDFAGFSANFGKGITYPTTESSGDYGGDGGHRTVGKTSTASDDEPVLEEGMIVTQGDGATATIDLIPDPADGAVSQDAGTTVITVDPETAIHFAAKMESVVGAATGYQLNFNHSDSALSIGAWTNNGPVFSIPVDQTLENDLFVAAETLLAADARAGVTLGTLVATAPEMPGDYRLTASFITRAGLADTMIANSLGVPLSVDHFGEVIIRVRRTIDDKLPTNSVNRGQTRRSMVTRIGVGVDRAVSVRGTGDHRLTRRDVDRGMAISNRSVLSGDARKAVVAFSGRSPVDGIYELMRKKEGIRDRSLRELATDHVIGSHQLFEELNDSKQWGFV